MGELDGQGAMGGRWGLVKKGELGSPEEPEPARGLWVSEGYRTNSKKKKRCDLSSRQKTHLELEMEEIASLKFHCSFSFGEWKDLVMAHSIGMTQQTRMANLNGRPTLSVSFYIRFVK